MPALTYQAMCLISGQDIFCACEMYLQCKFCGQIVGAPGIGHKVVIVAFCKNMVHCGSNNIHV